MPVTFTNTGIMAPPLGLDPATQAWVTAVGNNGGSVSSPRQTLVNNLIVLGKANGWFAKMDCLWLLAGENQPSGLTDIVGLRLASNTGGGGTTFTTDRGFAGNGSTYIDTTYNTVSSVVNFTQDNAHVSLYDRTNRAGITDIEAGVSNVSNTYFSIEQVGGSGAFAINGAFTSIANSPTQGFYINERTGSNATQFYKNGSSIGTDTTISFIPDSLTIFLCCRNLSGSPSSNSTDQLAAFSVGASLGTSIAASFTTDLNTYMTAIGANVF